MRRGRVYVLVICKLNCKYCCNKDIIKQFLVKKPLAANNLGCIIERDILYFDINGGVTFGGGEPLLNSDFIVAFHKLFPLMHLTVETSLNADIEEVSKLVDVVDKWIVDIKDMNSAIYKEYTGLDNSNVKLNLYYLAKQVGVDAVRVRVPLIPEFNSEEDVEKSVKELKELGFYNIDVFDYRIF